MDNTKASGNNGGYHGYGGVDNGLNNGGSDFEAQFRNMVATPEAEASRDDRMKEVNPESLNRMKMDDKNKILLIGLGVLALAGLAGIIGLTMNYLGALARLEDDEEIGLALTNGEQDDAGAYKDLAFSENDSDAPLLVYATVNNGEMVATEWLEEFRGASERYSKDYTNRRAIPSGATFGEVTVQTGLVGELYPEIDIIRFLLETSEGCARFDLYEDLLVIYDYEFSGVNCKETEWDYLAIEEDS